MAIKFKCAKCGQELNVKDELAGKQGKCPACKSVLTVPALESDTARAPAAARSAAARKPADDDVIEADIVDDAEVVDDDEPPRRKSSKRERDDDDDDRRSAITSSKRSRRDDDDDDRPSRRSRRRDDDDDDEDDRPRRSRRRNDDDDDDDDGGDARAKKREKAKRRLWRRTGIGLMLCMFGSWAYTAAWAVLLIAYIITMIIGVSGAQSAMGGGGGFGMMMQFAGFAAIVSYLALTLYVVSLVLMQVGGSMCITTPGRNGEMAIAISYVAVTGLVILFLLLFFFGIGALAMVILYPILELSRLTLLAVLQMSVCKSMKDHDQASAALKVGIIVPSSAFGIFGLNWVAAMALGRGGAAGAIILLIMWGVSMAAWIGELVWYSQILMVTRDTVD